MLFDAKLTILIVSPQPWDGIPVSKHNYAHELASLGHRVVFLDPPVQDGSMTGIDLRPSGTPGIEVLRYRLPLPYRLKFHARPLFSFLMARAMKRMTTAIGGKPDIVWDFDNAYTTSDLRGLDARVSIFHPVDDIELHRNGDKHADIVFAVAQRFLAKIEPKRVPMFVVAHGLSRPYESLARQVLADPVAPGRDRRPLTVGMVGNLDRPDIDWSAIRAMLAANATVTFRFTGPFTPALVEAGPHGAAFSAVKAAPNAVFEGRKAPQDITSRAHDIDVWLMAYDPSANANAATNSHKLLEYLATGSPVVSNRVESYAGSDLVAMPPTASNAALPGILSDVLATLDTHIGRELRARRATFALDHTYRAQLQQISVRLASILEAKRTQGHAHA